MTLTGPRVFATKYAVTWDPANQWWTTGVFVLAGSNQELRTFCNTHLGGGPQFYFEHYCNGVLGFAGAGLGTCDPISWDFGGGTFAYGAGCDSSDTITDVTVTD